MEAVEGVEKLLLEAFFSFHELNVIDEQNVDVAVAALEGCGGVCTNRVDIFIQECFGRDVTNFVVRVVSMDVPTNCLEKVCLTESGLSVNEERVV